MHNNKSTKLRLIRKSNKKLKRNTKFWDLKNLTVEFEGIIRRRVLRDKYTWPINYKWWRFKYSHYINSKDRPHKWRPNFPKIFPWRDLNFYSTNPNNTFRKKIEMEKEDQSFLETHYHTYYYKGLLLPIIDFVHYRAELIIWHIHYWIVVEGTAYFMYSKVCSKNKLVFGYLIETIKAIFIGNIFFWSVFGWDYILWFYKYCLIQSSTLIYENPLYRREFIWNCHSK